MKLSDYVFQSVTAAGVEHVFFLPGGGAMHLVDSLGRAQGIQPVAMLHEQAASIAAEAYARVRGGVGVALVTTGPGGTNALTGVAGGWIESTPMVIISGQVKRADLMTGFGLRQRGVQEVDIVGIASHVTKDTYLLLDPSNARRTMEGAFHTARTGRPGPVWVDIPLDVQAVDIEPAGQEPGAVDDRSPGDEPREAALRILDALAAAERPLILAGNGVRIAGAVDELRTLVATTGIPTVTSRKNGIDLFPSDHPFYFGRPGGIAHRYANFAVQTADLILVLGCRLDPVQVAYDWQGFGRRARKIMVDIDEREIAKLDPPVDVSVVADVGIVVRALLAGLRERGGLGDARAEARARWLSRCRSWRDAYPVVESRHRDLVDRVSTYVLAEALGDHLSASDTVVIGSSGAAIEAFMLAYSAPLGQRAFLTGGLGAMGFGLPAAIGACLGAGSRRTVLVDGDGGFLLNIQELATLRQLGLPIKIFILDNQGYGSIRSMQRRHFEGRLVGSDRASGLALPDLLQVAKAIGIRAATLDRHADLSAALTHVLDGPDPVICIVRTDPDEVPEPRVTSTVLADGTIETRPIEDLAPRLPPEVLAAALKD